MAESYNSLYGTAVYGTDKYGSLIAKVIRTFNKVLNRTFHKDKINNYLYKSLIIIFHKK